MTSSPVGPMQGRDGWDITRALAMVKEQAKAHAEAQSYRAAAAVEERVTRVGHRDCEGPNEAPRQTRLLLICTEVVKYS